jgi:hypothetical protein
MQSDEPLLSVVVTSRNDNHGESMLRRMQTFINALIAQAKRHQVRCELVIVEWNPPPENPKLAEVLHWPDDGGYCPVRIIEVPPEIHYRLPYSRRLPLFQMIAKNVGIRRARGEYVLATNIDIIFSDGFFRFLKSDQLKPGRMYRTDRWDVDSDVPPDASIDEQLAYCQTHLLRVNRRDGTYPLEPDGSLRPFNHDISCPGIIFAEGFYPPEGKPNERFRWAGPNARLIVTEQAPAGHRLCLEVRPGETNDWTRCELEIVNAAGEVVLATPVVWRQELHLRLPIIAGQRSEFFFRTPGSQVKRPWDLYVRDFAVFRSWWEPDTGGPDVIVKSRPEPTPDDLVVSPGVTVGPCFYPLEYSRGEPMRWGADGATLIADVPTHFTRPCLCIELEPGPSVGYLACTLVAMDEQNRPLATGRLERRQLVRLRLPGTGVQVVRLFTPESVGVAPNDHRILNFRLLGAYLDEAAADTADFETVEVGEVADVDVASLESGIRFAAGFTPPELHDQQPLRWGGDAATLILNVPGALTRPQLCLVVQPGPSVDSRAFTLRVTDQAGNELGRGLVQHRQLVRVRLPLVGERQQVQLHALESQGPFPGDGRVLNFALLSAYWQQAHPADEPLLVEDPCEVRGNDDVVAPDVGIAFGHHCAYVRADGQPPVRVLGEYAVIEVRQPATKTEQALCLEVEPGEPGKPLTVMWHSATGQVRGSAVVAKREVLRLRTGLAADQVGQFRLAFLTARTGTDKPPTLKVYRAGWEAVRSGLFGGSAPILSTVAADQVRWAEVPRVGLAPATQQAWWAIRQSRAELYLGENRLGALMRLRASLEKTNQELQKQQAKLHAHTAHYLHLNACGDFTMLARADWFALRGNPEPAIFSMHLDSVMCYVAHNAGYHETMLPEDVRIYHIEHSKGSGWTPEGEELLFARMASRGIPMLEYVQVARWAYEMYSLQMPMNFCKEDWGFGNEELPETYIGNSRVRLAA